MSSYGTYSLRLRRERLEQLRRRREEQRKQKVRQEAAALLADSRQMIKQYLGNMIQHFGQNAQEQSQSLAQQAGQLLQSDPDQALLLARRSRAAAERGLLEASHKTTVWTQEKAAAQEAVTVLQLALESLLNGASVVNSSDNELTYAANQLATAKVALRREDFDGAKEAALKGQDHLGKAEQLRRQEQEREEVRREIVRGLRHVLTKMGFTVKPPHLGQNSESGKVVLVGSLPSGRTARFVISLDGQAHYDFDGYCHRECGKDREKIHSQLEEYCQAEASDIEMYWKEEPIQIGKTSLDLPTNQKNKLS